MGGTTEPIIAALNDSYTENASLREAVTIAVDALRVGIASNAASSSSSSTTELRKLDTSTLEVAILDTSRPRRAFRRITASALEALLPEESPAAAKSDSAAD
jgi:proteasome alpha subunit